MSPPTDCIDVLHVEDDPNFADMAGQFLAREDDRISHQTATSAREGLEILANSEIDCIVSDYNMPGQDGITFLKSVREAHPDLPFILFTGKGSEAVASDAVSAGVTDYLQKESGTEQFTILANRITNAVGRERGERERERQLQAIETAQEGISILNEASEFIFVNQAFADLYGYEAEEMIGEHWRLIYVDEEIERIYEEVLPAVEADGYWNGQTTGLRADGSTFLEDHTLVSTDEDELICTVRDRSERKERELDLAQEREFVDQAINALDDVFYVVGVDGQPLRWNDRFAELTGYADEEIADMHAVEFFPEEEQPRIAETIEETLTTGSSMIESEVLMADGTRAPYELSGSRLVDTDGELIGFIGIARDITERRKRKRELERERKRFTTLYDNFPEPTLTYEFIDGKSIIRDVNDAFVEVFGYEADEAIGEWVGDLIVPPDKVTEAKAIDQQVKSGEHVDTELRRLTATGERHFWFRNISVQDSDTIDGFAVYADITERKEHERELERYETLVEASGDPMYMLDDEGCFTYVNDALVEITGYSEEALLGKYVPTVMTEDHVERGEDLIRSLLSAGKDHGTFELDIQTKDGERIPTENHIALLFVDGEFHGTLGILRDITDRLERERKLQRERDRLDRFAGVVSHDLRNPLNVARGRVDLATQDCESEHLEDVARALDRMQTLIDDVLTLARAGETIGETGTIDLADLVQSCWRNVDMESSAALRAETESTIRADKTRLPQLFENLFRNAVEQDGDGITVTVGDLDDGFYIEDDGQGIPKADREEVFETGYSNREEGTGLGLSIVKEIVQAHDWEIRVTAGSEGGARFEIIEVEFAAE